MKRYAIPFVLVAWFVGFAMQGLAAPRERLPAVAAGGPPKPSGPIDVAYSVGAALRVGQPVEIEITARAAVAGGLALEVVVPNGGTLAIASESAGTEVVDGRRWVVTVVPLAAGAAYLTVVVTGRIEGLDQSRSVVVPIRTAPAAQTVVLQETAVTPGGERLILLPVEEITSAPR
jgi:hypothetical protein